VLDVLGVWGSALCSGENAGTDHGNIEAWPFDKTNRSRLGQTGSSGSKFITRFQIV